MKTFGVTELPIRTDSNKLHTTQFAFNKGCFKQAAFLTR
ncbi:hypothetical protein P20652_1312 [Pseudoalteromonas sp. BSi20652]|nr:hypothetical protein P20652_1312 [Pseudoalteromonas sp. BSi20652]